MSVGTRASARMAAARPVGASACSDASSNGPRWPGSSACVRLRVRVRVRVRAGIRVRAGVRVRARAGFRVRVRAGVRVGVRVRVRVRAGVRVRVRVWVRVRVRVSRLERLRERGQAGGTGRVLPLATRHHCEEQLRLGGVKG